MKIYFDNAATTPVAPEVIQAMTETLNDVFGNPSSIHEYGRKARVLIENSRKSVANNLNVSPSEIIFTSGGTEADNTAIRGAVFDLGVKHIITSKIEHPAVLNTLDILEKENKVKVSFVKLTENGHIDLNNLEEILSTTSNSMVSLMHANNEIGNLLPMKDVSGICEKYNAFFMSDTVQTMGKYANNFQNFNLHFAACSAHKFYGPKGIGFLYINGNNKISPMLFGGGQERGMRSGTENIHGIVGLAKAMELSYLHLERDQKNISEMKSLMIALLKEKVNGISFNGDCENGGLYSLLNVSFPKTMKSEMLLQNLDINGIAVSGGSACASGSVHVSHVLEEISTDIDRPSIRFSFGRYNNVEEVKYTVEKLVQHLN
ncbi:MAG: cysteine desulfurase [Bacteroidetes bacterium]|nr:cysteine desulfurase [Bacteroidota bacterium]